MHYTRSEQIEWLKDLAPSFASVAKHGQPYGKVAEFSQHLSKGQPATPGFRVPLDFILQSRALTTNVFNAGGAFVQSNIGPVDPVPRAASVCLRAGAQLITNTGNLSLPRQTGAETISFLHETDTVTSTDSTLGSLNLTPHRLAGAGSITSQADVQSNGAASALILDSLAAGVAAALDRGALVGIGAAGDVLGLHYLDGVNSKTFGGAASWATITDMQSTVATNNADDERIAWIAHPEVRERWRNIQRYSGGNTLWHSDENTVAGNAAFVTSAAPATGVLCGDFTKLVFCFFGDSVNIIVDPFSQSMAGRISFVINAMADVGHLRPSLVVKNADTVIS